MSSTTADDKLKPRTSLESVAARLRELLERRAMSVTDLQAALERAGVEGSKYSNVRRYVAGEGKGPPSLDWIAAAARVLEARPAWLAFGEGEATREDEDAFREEFARFRRRFGRTDPDHIVLLVGAGEHALTNPERVVFIDATDVPTKERKALMKRMVAAASDTSPSTP